MERIISEFLALHNFQRAWEKVAEKRGCAGIDRETIDDFARNQALNIYELRNTVANGSYEPLPCKQVVIPKRNGNVLLVVSRRENFNVCDCECNVLFLSLVLCFLLGCLY